MVNYCYFFPIPGDRWGTRVDGRICRGCGPQEMFYGCADVRVSRNVSQRVPSLPQNVSQVLETAPKTYSNEIPPPTISTEQKYLSLNKNLSLSNIHQEVAHVVEKPYANKKLENLTLFGESNRTSGVATTSLGKVNKIMAFLHVFLCCLFWKFFEITENYFGIFYCGIFFDRWKEIP